MRWQPRTEGGSPGKEVMKMGMKRPQRLGGEPLLLGNDRHFEDPLSSRYGRSTVLPGTVSTIVPPRMPRQGPII